MSLLAERLGKRLIEVLKEERLINYIVIRDEEVLLIYKKLKSKGKTSKEARAEIEKIEFKDYEGNRYRLSDKSIQRIIYGNANQKIKPAKSRRLQSPGYK